MNITERFRAATQAFRTTKNSMGTELARDFLKHGNRNRPAYPDWSQVMMTDKDLYTGYSYAAINNRANLAAQLANENLKTKAKQPIIDAAKAKEEVVEHPYLGLVDISKSFSNYKFWYDISTFLDLEGVFYLFALRNKSGDRFGNIQYFKLLNPYDITRVLNLETLEVDSYMEVRSGMIRNIPPEMIIEIRKLNPFSYEEPFAMTDAAKDAQFTLKQAGDQMRNTIGRNNKFPGVALIGDSDVAMDPQQLENFKARMMGKDKRGEPVFATGQGALQWQDMQVDLGKSKHDVVNEINLNAMIAVTGNSKTMFGIEQSGVTRDTAEVQRDLFVQNHGMPQLQLIIDALNQDYKTNYEAEYTKTGYKITIDNPLGSDKAAEKTDTEIRQNEYDLYNALVNKGYERDIAAKYAEGRVTLEEIGEPTNEPVATPIPPTAAPANTPPADATPAVPPPAPPAKPPATNHIEHNHLPAVKNNLDDQAQGMLASHQGQLQNAIVNVEGQLVLSVLGRVTKNQFDSQSDILTEDERKQYENELELALAAFYGVILPLYAKSTMNRRISEFGKMGIFKLTKEVRDYIKGIASKTAQSHINTITDDLLTTIKAAYDKQLEAEIKAIKQAEASKLPADEAQKLLESTVSKDSEIYKLAQKKALEGAGQQQIVSAIKQEYKDISTDRAKTIARTETNRAFTQAQFQADKQFIEQNGLEGQAYKKWVTRSDNPCPICLDLASQPPVKFNLNFADLGDELSVTYEQDGKTKVLKQKINYEALSAGNAHANCACIYQLIIE